MLGQVDNANGNLKYLCAQVFLHFLFCIRLKNHDTSFSPMIEAMSVVMKKSLRNVAGSWKNTIPRMTVPTAPIPVHTGYAVPIGRVCTAFARSTMLSVRHRMNPAPQSQ